MIANLTAQKLAESSCKDEVIWRLYKACEPSQRAKKLRKVEIYLQDVNHPISVDFSIKALSGLKSKGIIADYELKTREENLPPIIIEETEPDIGLLEFASYEDIQNIPKNYESVSHSQIDYVAVITCIPQKVVDSLKDEFKRIDQKKEQISRREDIEASFDTEQVLECEGLKSGSKLEFGLESGNIVYGTVMIKYEPESDKYKVLKLLMENLNKRIIHQRICKTLFDRKNPNKWKWDLWEKWKKNPKNLRERNPNANRIIETDNLISKIRQDLKMSGENPKNENLIVASNGYRMVSKIRK